VVGFVVVHPLLKPRITVLTAVPFMSEKLARAHMETGWATHCASSRSSGIEAQIAIPQVITINPSRL